MRFYKITVESYWQETREYLVIDKTDTDAKIQLRKFMLKKGSPLYIEDTLRGWHIKKIERIYPAKTPVLLSERKSNEHN
jgi:hypothetical protein